MAQISQDEIEFQSDYLEAKAAVADWVNRMIDRLRCDQCGSTVHWGDEACTIVVCDNVICGREVEL